MEGQHNERGMCQTKLNSSYLWKTKMAMTPFHASHVPGLPVYANRWGSLQKRNPNPFSHNNRLALFFSITECRSCPKCTKHRRCPRFTKCRTCPKFTKCNDKPLISWSKLKVVLIHQAKQSPGNFFNPWLKFFSQLRFNRSRNSKWNIMRVPK